MAKAKGATALRRPRTSRSSGSGPVSSIRRRPNLLDVEVDIGSEDNYLFSYLTDQAMLGIFVRTLAPRPAGTFLTLHFSAAFGRGLQVVADARDDDDARSGELGDDFAEGLVNELTQDLTETASAATASQLEVELGDLDAELGAAAAARLGELTVEGEVIWVNPYRPSVKDNLHPGMGIRLLALDDLARVRLLAMVGRFAYLT